MMSSRLLKWWVWQPSARSTSNWVANFRTWWSLSSGMWESCEMTTVLISSSYSKHSGVRGAAGDSGWKAAKAPLQTGKRMAGMCQRLRGQSPSQGALPGPSVQENGKTDPDVRDPRTQSGFLEERH